MEVTAMKKMVVKVWCLPKMMEVELNELHKNIVAAVVSVKEFGLGSENDMVCLFPSDMMFKGLGEEIIIEVVSPFDYKDERYEINEKLTVKLGKVVVTMFPEAFVQCDIYSHFWVEKCSWSNK
ncbi:MAG: hypothetical protein V1711_00430 [bacterium]